MPVGCLSGEGGETEAGSSLPHMDTIVTSSVLNSAEQFAFMQQTLLMQIFRVNPKSSNGNSSRVSSPSSSCNGRNGSSPSQHSTSTTSTCPTCIAFNDHCCQVENGADIFHEFIEINLQCYWDAKLSEALMALKYQGYVCPGILVLIANSHCLDMVADAWRRRILQSPPTCRLSQVGLSNGCIVKPVMQTHCIALPDILCLILARLKQRNEVADMNILCEEVERDWSGSSLAKNGTGIRDAVHTALGRLIKQRKVYYTGNKGYFLVTPSDNGNSPLKGIGTRFSHFRHSLRDKSIFNGKSSSSKMVDQECQTVDDIDQGTSGSPQGSHNASLGSNESGESGSYHLERSQSLRFSKKSIRNVPKGGSLRLSKRDAIKLREEIEEERANEPAETATSPDTSNSNNETPPKNFERKNSFLGKLFNSSKRKNSGNTNGPKPEIVSFSAQFPPPELVEHYNSIYSAIQKPKTSNGEQSNKQYQRNQQASDHVSINNNQKTSFDPLNHHRSYPKPAANFNLTYGTTSSLTSSPTTQIRNGPNGNFVIYERSGRAVYHNQASHVNSGQRSLPGLPMNAQHGLPIYAQHGLPVNSQHGLPINGQNGQDSVTSSNNQQHIPRSSPQVTSPTVSRAYPETAYSNPPPPLPYRPPPNPYYTASQPGTPQNFKRNSADDGGHRSPLRGFMSSNSSTGTSHCTSSSSGSSGPSSMDSQTLVASPKLNQKPLFDDSLVVIEKSNQELESKLSPKMNSGVSRVILRQSKSRLVDTIHNHRNNLSQEVIYEVSEDSAKTTPEKPTPTATCSENHKRQESDDSAVTYDTIIPSNYPSISDLTLGHDAFKSLTAQKLMAGLSFNSIDTLLEVNAAADARNKMDESSETIDFGVI